MNCQCTCPDTPAEIVNVETETQKWLARHYTGDVPTVEWSQLRVMDNRETGETAIALKVDGKPGWWIRGPKTARWVEVRR